MAARGRIPEFGPVLTVVPGLAEALAEKSAREQSAYTLCRLKLRFGFGADIEYGRLFRGWVAVLHAAVLR